MIIVKNVSNYPNIRKLTIMLRVVRLKKFAILIFKTEKLILLNSKTIE